MGLALSPTSCNQLVPEQGSRLCVGCYNSEPTYQQTSLAVLWGTSIKSHVSKHSLLTCPIRHEDIKPYLKLDKTKQITMSEGHSTSHFCYNDCFDHIPSLPQHAWLEAGSCDLLSFFLQHSYTIYFHLLHIHLHPLSPFFIVYVNFLLKQNTHTEKCTNLTCTTQ